MNHLNSIIIEGVIKSVESNDTQETTVIIDCETSHGKEEFKILSFGKMSEFVAAKATIGNTIRAVGRLSSNGIVAEHIEIKGV